MAKSAPTAAPPAAPVANASFGNTGSVADPRMRSAVSQPPPIAPVPTQSSPAQPAPAVNPIAALAALLPQATTAYDSFNSAKFNI